MELRALSVALERPIHVYSTTTNNNTTGPLEILPNTSPSNEDPIRVSYHRHYYALGEHYNQVQVVPLSTKDNNDNDNNSDNDNENADEQ